MVVKEYTNASAFLEDYKVILLEREAVSQLILYNSMQCCNRLIDEKALFGAVIEEDRIVLLFCNVAPYNLVIYIALEEDLAAASGALADYLANKRVIINGINARHDICLGFMDQYKKYINCSFIERIAMIIMELRELNDINPVEGFQRLALPEETKLVAEWMIEYQMEALTSETDYEAALKRADIFISEGNIYLYENTEGKVVSMAIASRKLETGMAISYVYTPEEYRGKGYAAANLYYLCKELLGQGNQFCSLFVDQKHLLSIRSYEKVGFRILEDNYEYKLIAVDE